MVTMMTALEIAGNPDDIVVTHAGPTKNGKYIGWITRGPGHNYKPLISSEPVFDTPEDAEKAMQKVVEKMEQVADKELQDPDSTITQFLRSPDGQVVQEIIEKAHTTEEH